MLYGIAPEEHQAPLAVDRQRIDYGEPWQLPTRYGSIAASAIAADGPDDQNDEGNDDRECYDVLNYDRTILAEDLDQHVLH